MGIEDLLSSLEAARFECLGFEVYELQSVRDQGVKSSALEDAAGASPSLWNSCRFKVS